MYLKVILLVLLALLSFFVFNRYKVWSNRSFRWKEINPTRILENIATLSSDEYEGRGVSTRGEELTIAFIENQFKKVGLKPGNPDGTYFQNVPMVGMKVDPSAELLFTNMKTGKQEKLQYANDFTACTKRVLPSVSIDHDVVFVGYGIEAQEYGWNDFKDVDVRGKILVVLINDPPVPDPEDPSKLDEKTFKGKALTYYGRWTYKFEKAAEKGALGCLIVHETGPAGYPWDVVRTSFTGENFSLVSEDKGMSSCAIEGWITCEKAKALFALAGKDFQTLAKSAIQKDFVPVDLSVKGQLTLNNSIRTIQSKNVIGKIEGKDPKLSSECIIYTAHWDHLGIGPEINGDKIYHGAVDNASGVSGLIEIADALMHNIPPRSILFLCPTSEESGLLGTRYYCEHPLYPLNKTLANINVDGMNMLGRTKDLIVVGLDQSNLDEVISSCAKKQDRIVKPDGDPEKGYFFRGDHFNFAKVGIPSIAPGGISEDYVGRPKGWGHEMGKKITQEDYHRPSDVVKPYWDLSGTVEDLQLFSEVGYQIASFQEFPEWKANSEFKSLRCFTDESF